jgi:hypothetical protein
MISRTAFCSAQPAVMREARYGPIVLKNPLLRWASG